MPRASSIAVVILFALLASLIILAFVGPGGQQWNFASSAAAIAGITVAGAIGFLRFVYTWEFRPAVNLSMTLEVVHNDQKRLTILARITIRNPTRVGAEIGAKNSEFNTRAAMLHELPAADSDKHVFFLPRPRHEPFAPLNLVLQPEAIVQGVSYPPLRAGATNEIALGGRHQGGGQGRTFKLAPHGEHNLIAWGMYLKGRDLKLKPSGPIAIEAAFRVKLEEPGRLADWLVGAEPDPASDVFAMCVANAPEHRKPVSTVGQENG